MDASHIRAFTQIGSTNRSLERRFRDLAALADLIKNLNSIRNEVVQRGIRYATDESRLLLALCPSRNELDLEMKAALLIGGKPMMKENVNLMPMIDAALIEDTQRIRPGTLPFELRAKFRN